MPHRIGYEITRFPDEEWESVIVRYSKERNLTIPVMLMYNQLVNDMDMEPYVAALRSLSEYGCVDFILDDKMHKKDDTVVH